MTIGDRVRVLPRASYNARFTGCVGVVVYSTGLCADRVGVKLDGTNNPRSKYNAFWFALDEIAIIESEDNFMLNDYITANVQFLDGTNHNMQYSYALYDPTICVSDIVVVKTGHHGFALQRSLRSRLSLRRLFSSDARSCLKSIFRRIPQGKRKLSSSKNLSRKWTQRSRYCSQPLFMSFWLRKTLSLPRCLPRTKNLPKRRI